MSGPDFNGVCACRSGAPFPAKTEKAPSADTPLSSQQLLGFPAAAGAPTIAPFQSTEKILSAAEALSFVRQVLGPDYSAKFSDGALKNYLRALITAANK